MILDNVCPIDERGARQAGGRGANWEAGVQVWSNYILHQSDWKEKADRRRNSRL